MRSLRWRLPILVCGLVALVLVTFLWAAYWRVEATLVRAAGERAQVAADQIAGLLDGQRTVEQVRQLEGDPVLLEFLKHRTEEAREAARTRLSKLSSAGSRRLELWDNGGSRLLEFSNTPPREEEAAARTLPPGSPPFVPGIRPLQTSGDIVFTDIVVEIRDESAPLGILLIRSTFTESPPGIFNRLVGRDALVRIGNRTGDVWSSLSNVVPAAPVDLSRPGVAQYRAEDGQTHIGAVAHVRATPLAVWVEFPLATVIAPARVFLSRMIPVAIIFLLCGGVLAGILSGRITGPLGDLTAAAEAIATGDYAQRVAGDRHDEIGRLGRTFNVMASQVQDAHQRLEARVAERTARLEAVNKELEAFSYSVSHDLRTPLRAIDGFSQALLEDSADVLDAKSKSHLQRVRAAAQRMGELIDNLLDFSRVGRGELRRLPVSISDVGRAVTTELRKADPERQVDVAIQEGLVGEVNRRLVQIVLENLLGNAWKFTKKAKQANIQLGAEQRNGEVVYFVRDNGAGFDMTYMDKLFRPFQRLHTEADFPGTGIGLATVHRIVDRHRGRIWAEGAVGAGATVYFTLPPEKNEALA